MLRHFIRSFFSSNLWRLLFVLWIGMELSAAPAPLPEDAVSWWKGDNNANDSVGASNGTLQNGAAFTIGQVGQAFDFDGINDTVRIPAPYTAFGSAITVEYWINKGPSSPDSGMAQSTENVFSVNDTVWMMKITRGAYIDWFVNDGGNWRVASTPDGSLATSGWHHIAGVGDGTSVRIYFDGVLSPHTNPGVSIGILSNPSAVLVLGTDPATSTFFKGQLDEVTVYNRALTGVEVQAIYSAGPAGKGGANAAPTFVGATTEFNVLPDSPATDITALLHVSDTDSGQTLTWTQSSGPSKGSLSFSGATASSGGTDITPGGTITYTPAAGFLGTDTFTVQVSDGTASATRTITVVVNTPPIFGGVDPTITVGTSSSATVLWSYLRVADRDSGQTLTWSQSTAPSHGTLVNTGGTAPSGGFSLITPGGSIAYTPTLGFAGTDSFIVQVNDGIDSATRTVTFNMANTAPSFVGPSMLVVTMNSGANDIKGALQASDSLIGGEWETLMEFDATKEVIEFTEKPEGRATVRFYRIIRQGIPVELEHPANEVR